MGKGSGEDWGTAEEMKGMTDSERRLSVVGGWVMKG